jgi:hypothetical protein
MVAFSVDVTAGQEAEVRFDGFMTICEKNETTYETMQPAGPGRRT